MHHLNKTIFKDQKKKKLSEIQEILNDDSKNTKHNVSHVEMDNDEIINVYSKLR